jgi:hypothetical protein
MMKIQFQLVIMDLVTRKCVIHLMLCRFEEVYLLYARPVPLLVATPPPPQPQL